MHAGPRPLAAVAGLILLGTLAPGCAPKPPAQELLGELRPIVSVKELMEDLIDPLSDNIFEAVGTEVNMKGIIETEPRNDADWAKVRSGAVALAEGVNLLKIPRPFAPAGDLNKSEGPNAPELSPDAIKAKVNADKALWNKHIEELRAVALSVLEIVKRKDVPALFDAGGQLDKACENCHLEYWYPGDKKLVLEDEAQKSGYVGKSKKN